MKRSIAIFFCIAVCGPTVFAQEKKPPPPPPPPPAQIIKYVIVPPAAELDRFYAKNPSVSKVYYQKKGELIIDLKNGKQELYDLDSSDQYRAYSEKYEGDPPAFPPPPPPPPPKKVI